VLSDGTSTVAVAGNGAFTFPSKIASGAAYAVSVAANPVSPWQTCIVSNGAGVVGSVNVTNVAVSCATNAYAVSVNVTMENPACGQLYLSDGVTTIPTQQSSGTSQTYSFPALPSGQQVSLSFAGDAFCFCATDPNFTNNLGRSATFETFTVGGSNATFPLYCAEYIQ
jgi:hypothetical protein